MSATRALIFAALCALSLGLAACGAIDVKPKVASASRGVVDDPRTSRSDRIACLRANKLSVQLLGGTDLLVNGSVRVHFDPSPGGSEYDQISDREQGAEVIGSALVYPGDAPDAELTQIETCIAQGVKG